MHRPIQPRTRFQPPRSCGPHRKAFQYFLLLPAELRAKVYSYLLLSTAAIDVTCVWRKIQPLSVSVLRANKFISVEAAHYLYSANTFILLEHCDAHNNDGDDLDKHPGFIWLNRIGKNALSIRNIHLRIRKERPISYTTTLQLPTLARLAPNLTRLAIILEAHQVIESSIPAQPVLNFFPQRTVLPNKVVTLAGELLARLVVALSNLTAESYNATIIDGGGVDGKGKGKGKGKEGEDQERRQKGWDLKIVQIGGNQRSHRDAGLDLICAAVRCRVQGIDGFHAARDRFTHEGVLWERMGRGPVWYDGVPERYGEGAKQLVAMPKGVKGRRGGD